MARSSWADTDALQRPDDASMDGMAAVDRLFHGFRHGDGPVDGTVVQDPARGDRAGAETGVDRDWWSDELWPVVTKMDGAMGQVAHGLRTLGLTRDLVDALVSVVTCAAAHEAVASSQAPVASTQEVADDELLDAAAAVRRVQGFAESVAVAVARSLTHRAGVELLSDRKLASPDELSVTARARWRAKAKSVTAHELSVLTGHTVWRCRSMVGFAQAPPVAAAPVEAALRAGVCDWRNVEAWWSRCRGMEVQDAATVAEAVFGPLLEAPDTPEDIAEGQTDGPDASRVQAESWSQFQRRLDREVVRVQGVDAEAARARRQAAVDTRDAAVEICDDGLGSIRVSGPTAAVVGAADRIETIARRARAAGDERPLHHIRADTALGLLVHGVLPLAGASSGGVPGAEAGNDWLVDVPAEVVRIISGLPRTSVELILPLDALNPPTADCAHQPTSAEGAHQPASADCAHQPPTADCSDGACTPSPPSPCLPPRGSLNEAVGEIAGRGFLTAEHARDMVLHEGTTIHRLVTDPLDGRLIERSVAAYRPDQAMVAQIRAADRFCRAPGCLVPGPRCDIDHERPYSSGGATAEPNLGLKHRAHHALKTEGFWSSVMDETRTVTWRTLFGRIYRTRAHDYRQYGPAVSNGCERPTALDLTAVDDPDLRDRLVYAALCSRHGQDSWLEALDDIDQDDSTWSRATDRPLALFHRVDGRRRPGAPPGQATPEAMLEPDTDTCVDTSAGPDAHNDDDTSDNGADGGTRTEACSPAASRRDRLAPPASSTGGSRRTGPWAGRPDPGPPPF